jgi:glycosyltransferase involved in cell wall biosynthesis
VDPPFLLVAGDFVRTGGMDRANFELAMSLAKRSHEVELVGHFADPGLVAMANVSHYRAARPVNSHFLGEPFLDRAGVRRAREISARGGRVIVNGGNCNWGDINWVQYVHAAYEPVVAGSALLRARWRWNHRSHLRAERDVVPRARIVLANSERTRRDVIEHLGVPERQVHRVYYGVDPSTYRPIDEASRRIAKEKFGWNARHIAVFAGGVGDRRKGFDVVFDAWKILASRAQWDVDLVAVGAGAELASWKARAKAAGIGIHFLGFRKDLAQILEACDVLIAPAKYEAYGIAVQEGLCMAIPAVISRSSGVAEHYREGPSELSELLLNDSADAQELVERLRNWRERKDRFDALTLELSSLLRAHTWDEMTAEILQIVEAG